MNDTGRSWRRSGAARVLLGAIVSGAATMATAGDCKFSRLAEIPITMNGTRPLIDTRIDGREASFLIDSGAFYSVISRATADQYALHLRPAPTGMYMIGLGGRVELQIATVKDFSLAGIPVRNVEFLVGGSEVGSGAAGLIGQNLLSHFDVEYDLAHGALRLFRAESCSKRMLAYWVAPGQSYSTMSIEWPTPRQPHTVGVGYLNGTRIDITFDTGAAVSLLSRHAAARAGLRPDSPGVVDAGYMHGLGNAMEKTYVGTFDSFKVGDDEEIQHARLRFIDSDLPVGDMLLGADFFLSHRIMVANSQHRLYVTYNGGPVFDLRTRPASAPPVTTSSETPAVAPAQTAAAAAPPAAAPAATSDGAGGERAAGDTLDAAGFARRGVAESARNDLAAAIADLTRACELDAAVAEYRYQRGVAYWKSRDPARAKADFDRALELRADYLPALIARAQLALGRGDRQAAARDLAAAEAAAPRQADQRLALAELDLRADRAAAAVADLDDWIPEHRVDSRRGGALLWRCVARAQAGSALDGAIDDCGGIIKHSPAGSPAQRAALQSRGLVRLRQGRYADALEDYDHALKNDTDPSAWALYGRGVAELRTGKPDAGRADISAAQKRWPEVAARFQEMGLVPEGLAPADPDTQAADPQAH